MPPVPASCLHTDQTSSRVKPSPPPAPGLSQPGGNSWLASSPLGVVTGRQGDWLLGVPSSWL